MTLGLLRLRRAWSWAAVLVIALTSGGPVLAAELPPAIASPSAILMDAGSGRVLYAKNAETARPPASMTKLMTLVVALNALKAGKVRWNTPIGVSERAYHMGGSQIWLEPGETLPFRQMMLGIAVGSANDACVAVAEHLYGSEEAFVAAMNRMANSLGMTHTHYVNSHGLDAPGHELSAHDMARLARYAVNLPGVLELTHRREDRSVRDGKGGTLWLVNPNRLLVTYPGVDGLKTGYTSQAGYCITATVAREGMRLIAVVMGAPSAKVRNADASALLSYGFANYEVVPVAKAGETMGSLPVLRGTHLMVPAVLAKDLAVLVEKGQPAKLTRRVQLTSELSAPVAAGQNVGRAVVLSGSQIVASAPLVAGYAVDRLSGFKMFVRLIEGVFGFRQAA